MKSLKWQVIGAIGAFCLVFFIAAAPPKMNTYVGKFFGDGAGLTNVAGGGGSQVWTNDSNQIYPVGDSYDIDFSFGLPTFGTSRSITGVPQNSNFLTIAF